MNLPEVYIIDAKRTPVCGPFKQLKNFSSSKLAAFVVKNIITKNKIDKSLVRSLILGNVVSAGCGQNVARQVCFLSELEANTEAFCVNNVCGSSLQSIILAEQSIQTGQHDCVLAGGTESSTHSPKIQINNELELKDASYIDGLYCNVFEKSMGQIVEQLSKKYKISRVLQDQLAYNSHQKAAIAAKSNYFQKEIVLINNQEEEVCRDTNIRRNISLDVLSSLPTTFDANGTVTAGNSCKPSDGAAMIMLSNRNFCIKNKIEPLAKVIKYSINYLDVNKTFESDVSAIKDLLNSVNLNIKDIDLFEIAESFAAQCIYTKTKLGLDEEKVNISGGDLAIGHPLGAAGVRILVTLIHNLKRLKLKMGLVCIPFGSGGSIAMLIESI